MAINIKGIDSNKIYGDVLPEYIPPSLEKDLAIEREINSESNGYTPDKSLRKIASVDPSAMYNYAMLKGIPSSKHGEYWDADNKKNLIRFIEEFPVFKVVDKPL
jgi:hypothetical protein